MSTTTTTTGRAGFLRLVLALDAGVTGVNGLAYLAAAGPLSDLLGPGAGLLRGIGVFLIGYAVAVGLLAARGEVSEAGTRAVIGLNLAWAVAGVLAVVAGLLTFSTLGAVWTVLQALVVAGFAALQIAGLRRLR
ncbi:hypothetical protein OUY22_35905 [Nonomuraea sp. MCN248]|uniref:Integral membrane protein n=1 Tax=Nonomuraea corallina TaxID=2989783 RepID=A0ABT4SNK2_9ACTN|nr:hypothetical protein [Nonomuraea corallina]MDA0638826.1 hypothetical protein [Nonomuraea corallina]